MGESFSRYLSLTKNAVNVISRKRKRQNNEHGEAEDECLAFLDKTMHTPKRKKLTSTAEYIHRTLFKEGQGSDVTVIILNKEWKLHRLYLSQSPYFLSMFSGSWKEATEDTITIEVVDPNVTLKALDMVLGSLYMNEFVLEPADVTATLAAATLFQLDGIVDKCIEIMTETVNFQTVIEYHYTADVYCLNKVKDATYKWLLINLLGFMQERPEKLKEIRAPLMISLITNPDLFVMQIEFYVYTMLRYWTFLKLRTGTTCVEASKEYFCNQPGRREFLRTKRGAPFVPVFRRLRLGNLMHHHMDVDQLKRDRLLPWTWLAPCGLTQWNLMLRTDHGPDVGPRTISDAEFLSKCIRCGRMLRAQGENVWRWTGFNFGLDLIWSVAGGRLKLRRAHQPDNATELMLSQQLRRHLVLRVTLLTLDEQRQVRHSQTTGVLAVALEKNQEVELLELDPEVKFPLHVSVNLLVSTPYRTDGRGASTSPKQPTVATL